MFILCVCLIIICTCVRVHTHVFTGVQTEAIGGCGAFSLMALLICLAALTWGVFLNPKLTNTARSACLHPLPWGLACCVGAGDLNSGPHGWTASPLTYL